MRTARLQTSDLGRADHFFGALLSKESVKEAEKALVVEPARGPQVNGASIALRDAKPRFSDPPAPPPQQPLPEKPDVVRSHAFDPLSPSLKRSNTERPRSVPSLSPIRQESSSQIISLVEALASAKKEIDTQSARMRDLEEMLQKERQARELAEEAAKRLESQSSESKKLGHTNSSSAGSVIEAAFEPPSETSMTNNVEESAESNTVDTTSISASTSLLEQRLETLLVEMQQMREQMESFKKRAETAEAERDNDRETLAQMVEKIRTEDSAKRSSSTERERSPHLKSANGTSGSFNTLGPILQKSGLSNGHLTSSREATEQASLLAETLSRPPGGRDPLLYHATPYASMLGVVLIGMGFMAYMNGWQPPKVDR